MPRYIDADALITSLAKDRSALVNNHVPHGELHRIDETIWKVVEAQTADVVPVVRGEWICNPDDKKFSLVCSACGQVMPFIPEYLPDNPPFCNCGADMRRESEENE